MRAIVAVVLLRGFAGKISTLLQSRNDQVKTSSLKHVIKKGSIGVEHWRVTELLVIIVIKRKLRKCFRRRLLALYEQGSGRGHEGSEKCCLRQAISVQV